jgi:hypothetical protein
MKQHDTKAEAEIKVNAKAIELMHSGKGCTPIRISDGAYVFFELDPETGEPGEKHKFVYAAQQPTPEKYTPVIDADNNCTVYYSRGTLDKHGRLNVSETADCFDNDDTISIWEPIDLVPAGRMQRAVDAVKDAEMTLQAVLSIGVNGGPQMAGEVRDSIGRAQKLLDEIRAEEG